MNLDLTDEQAAALLKELNEIIDGDRYFMSRRIRTLKEIAQRSVRSRYVSLYHRRRSMPRRVQPEDPEGADEALCGRRD